MTEQKTRYPDEFEIQKKVQNAIECLLIRDRYLLEHNVNERSISHRLASYLQVEFGEEWHVDCEYNRYNDDPKRLSIPVVSIKSNDTNATTVYPDIIVHRRGKSDNLLVIEVKKGRASGQLARDHDLDKLQEFQRDHRYRYHHALYLQLKTEVDAGVDEMLWDDRLVTIEDKPLGKLLEGFMMPPSLL